MIRLSPTTWVEEEYLITTNREVAAAWYDLWIERSQERGARWADMEQWRLPRIACKLLYMASEGEPEITGIMNWEPGSPLQNTHMHLRALLVCGGSAESLRVFHTWLKEE